MGVYTVGWYDDFYKCLETFRAFIFKILENVVRIMEKQNYQSSTWAFITIQNS